MTTTDLEKFGIRELKMLEKLLKAFREQGLPHNFDASNVVPMLNLDSGYVFLTNSDYDVAMLNGDKLEKWHHCSNCGHEGFLEDFEHNTSDEDCRNEIRLAGIPL